MPPHLLNSQRICLLFFFLTSSPLMIEHAWIVYTLLKILAVILAFCIIIWCTFQTLDILNAFNIKLKRNKITSNSLQSQSISQQQKEESYRASTYNTYPSGWYPLCWSSEVKKGQVIQRNALGKYYAIFRGETSGEIGILNAYCPHMGANLSVGGIVCNNELQCPFHLWKFNKNGKCTDIPYLTGKNKKIPKNAHTKCYKSIEYHDMICVYYDNRNTDNNDSIPLYNLPIQHDLLKSNYSYIGSVDYGTINMNIQEFAENAADWMHFAPIHGKMMFPFTQIEIPLINNWLSVHHSPATHIGGTSSKDSKAIQENNYGPDNKYFLYFINKAILKWNGKTINNSNGNAKITFCGPCGICIFRFVIPAFDKNAEIVLFHTHLPEDNMNLRVRFHWYANNKIPRLLVWYVVGNWISQWTNDIMIWENKIMLKKPCLVRGDGPIWKVRRWFRQFYPQNNAGNNSKVVVGKEEKDKERNEFKEVNEVNNKGSSMDW
eukprot:459689_1